MNAEIVDRFPTFRRAYTFLRPALLAGAALMRILFGRRALCLYAAAVTLVCLFYAGYNHHYGRQWEAEKQRILAAGGSLDNRKLFPPTQVRDEDNFFATPALRNLFIDPRGSVVALRMWCPERSEETARLANGREYKRHLDAPWGGSLTHWCDYFRAVGTLPSPAAAEPGARELLADHRFDGLIAELRTAALRPESAIPSIHDFRSPGSFESTKRWTLSFQLLTRLMRDVTLHARACAAAGDPAGAVADARVLLALLRGYAKAGATHYQLMVDAFGEITREGILARTWTRENLEALLSMDPGRYCLDGLTLGFQMERARDAGLMENHESTMMGNVQPFSRPAMIIRLFPRGWWLKEAVVASRNYEALLAACRPFAPEETLRDRWKSLPELGGHLYAPYPVTPGVRESFARDVYAVTVIRPLLRLEVQRLALRLELHRLRHGRYPVALAELELGGAEKAFKGLDGHPIHYRTDAEGHTLRLWTPGTFFLKSENSTEQLVFSTEPPAAE